MLFTFWGFLADWSFSVACLNETFQSFEEKRQIQIRNQTEAHFAYPKQLSYQNWKENKIEKVQKSLIQHSYLMFIEKKYYMHVKLLYAARILSSQTGYDVNTIVVQWKIHH
jgi:organic radical activating enzyme